MTNENFKYDEIKTAFEQHCVDQFNNRCQKEERKNAEVFITDVHKQQFLNT